MAKLPSDRAKMYDDSKDPPSFKDFDKQYNKEKGPNIISPPTAYNPPDKSAFKKGGAVKKYDDGGPVASSASNAPASTPPKFSGRISAGKDPDTSSSGDNRMAGRIKASEFKKGGAVTKKKR